MNTTFRARSTAHEQSQRVRDLEILLEIFKRLYRTTDVDSLLALIVDEAIELAGAERGALVYIQSDNYFVKVAKDNVRRNMKKEAFHLSKTIVNEAVRRRETMVVTDTWKNNGLAKESVVNLGIRTVITAPIIIENRVIALIYLDSSNPTQEEFPERKLQTLRDFAGQVEVALAQAQLMKQVRLLPKKLVEAQEQERARIARELHDETGQALTSISINLQLLETAIGSVGDETIRLFVNTKDMVNNVADNLHRLAMDLRPASLDKVGLVASLRQLVNKVGQENSTQASFTAEGMDGIRISQEAETSLYRIVQEALTNVVRHAHAAQVEVLIRYEKGRLKLTIEDNGNGFEERGEDDDGTHLGLVGMRERVSMIGGFFKINSVLKEGTTIIVTLPC